MNSINLYLTLGIVFIFAFLGAFLSLPFLIERIKSRHLVGRDMNKFDNREVPELGGISVLLGVSLGAVISIFIFTYLDLININLTYLLAALATIILIGFLGLIDDLIGWKKGIQQWQHALVPVLAALPLMAVQINNPVISLPFIGFLPAEFILPVFGVVSFGIIYSLFIVPIGITGASNAANMLAGFNGLEAGLGALIALTLLIISVGSNAIESAILMAALLGALLAFLKFNWFPAKVFGGDSLTLLMGATIAAAAIIGDMEKIGVLLFSLYFIEFIFKAKHKFKSECFGVPLEDGTLSPSPEGGSLTHWVMRRGKFTEPQVTKILLGMQAIVCGVVLLFYNFRIFVV